MGSSKHRACRSKAIGTKAPYLMVNIRHTDICNDSKSSFYHSHCVLKFHRFLLCFDGLYMMFGDDLMICFVVLSKNVSFLLNYINEQLNITSILVGANDTLVHLWCRNVYMVLHLWVMMHKLVI